MSKSVTLTMCVSPAGLERVQNRHRVGILQNEINNVANATANASKQTRNQVDMCVFLPGSIRDLVVFVTLTQKMIPLGKVVCSHFNDGQSKTRS